MKWNLTEPYSCRLNFNFLHSTSYCSTLSLHISCCLLTFYSFAVVYVTNLGLVWRRQKTKKSILTYFTYLLTNARRTMCRIDPVGKHWVIQRKWNAALLLLFLDYEMCSPRFTCMCVAVCCIFLCTSSIYSEPNHINVALNILFYRRETRVVSIHC